MLLLAAVLILLGLSLNFVTVANADYWTQNVLNVASIVLTAGGLAVLIYRRRMRRRKLRS